MNTVAEPLDTPDAPTAPDQDAPLSTPDEASDPLDLEAAAAPHEALDGSARRNAPAHADVHHALRAMEATLTDQKKELDGYRRLFDELRADAEQRLQQADEEAFLDEVRQSYQKDPVAAFRMMLDRSQYELWRALQDELRTQIRVDAERRSELVELLNHPENADIKPYLDEMRYLVSERGFDPQEASSFLKTVANKAAITFRSKAHAVQQVRRRSAVESGGGPSRAADPDREFYRIIKKAKTLDDMFEGLRKAGHRATSM